MNVRFNRIRQVSIGSAVFAKLTADCPILYNGPPLPPSRFSLPMWDVDLRLIYGSLGHSSPQPKLHLDRFSRFCRAHYCDRQTDIQTNRTRSVTVARIYLRSTAMQPNSTLYLYNAKIKEMFLNVAFQARKQVRFLSVI